MQCRTPAHLNVECLTAEDPPEGPCERCTKKGLKCEYITISNQQAEPNKAVPPDTEFGGRGSSSSPDTSRRMDVAHPSGYSPYVHPGMYPSNPQPNHLHGSYPNAQYRQPQDRNPPPGYRASGQYNGATSSLGLPGTMQPDPYLYSSRNPAPIAGYSADPGRAQIVRAPYFERDLERQVYSLSAFLV